MIIFPFSLPVPEAEDLARVLLAVVGAAVRALRVLTQETEDTSVMQNCSGALTSTGLPGCPGPAGPPTAPPARRPRSPPALQPCRTVGRMQTEQTIRNRTSHMTDFCISPPSETDLASRERERTHWRLHWTCRLCSILRTDSDETV